jgi:hypothetical protein
MSYVDLKYINAISPRLEKFTKKKDYLYNFRCPYCGDSKKNKNRARGFFFRMKADMVFKCHNCGVGRTLTNFLKDMDVNLHDQYVMERYRNGLTGKGTTTASPKFTFEKPKFNKVKSIGLEKISELNTTHLARQYLQKRNIEDLHKFYYCPKFKQWTNEIAGEQIFTDLKYDGPRIIIPLRDEEGTMFGFQGRSISNEKLRYITIMLDNSKPKIYGLDNVNPEKEIYVTEGPFDSHFIDNAIAMCGSDVNLSSYDYRFIYTYDNEPRSREIVNKITSAIKRGDKVVIFPSNVCEKDINDMVLAGHDVKRMIESNVYQGLEAKLKLNIWKKV